MNEKKYELIKVRYGRITRRIYVDLLETSYEYRRQGKAAEELNVIKKKVRLKLKADPATLESLPEHENEAVRLFCEQIAETAGEGKCPLWLKRRIVERLWAETQEKIAEDRRRASERFDEEAKPYREKAKKLTEELLSAYADREAREKTAEGARVQLARFDGKSQGLLYRFILRRYYIRKRSELTEALCAAERELSDTMELVRTLEAELCVQTRGITIVEHSRTLELKRIEAGYRLAERAFADGLDALK